MSTPRPRRTTLADAVTRAVALLATDLPEWTVNAPGGGSVLWVDTGLADTGPYVLLAGRHGLHLAPGSIATPHGPPAATSASASIGTWDLLEVGIGRLAFAWRELAGTPAPVLG